jgi:predicted metal-dependent peptidase/intein/homing endonuclease
MSNLEIMEKVSIRLIQSQPFYASLLSQMRKIECTGELAKQIPTEAVAVENGRINFYYNPKFLETLTVDEAVAVLQHECHHVILGHLVRMRDEYKENATLANISQDMNCLTPDTFLLGPNKRIGEVKEGEFVLGRTGQLKKITYVFKRDYTGDLLQIKTSSVLPLSVTPEHPLLVIKRKHERHPIELTEADWTKASDLKENDYLLIPKIKSNTDVAQLDLKPFVNSDPLLRNRIIGTLKDLKLELTEDLAWILGFYAADGSNNIKGGIGLNFSLHSKEIHYARKIQKFFKAFGYSSRLIKGKYTQENPAFIGELGMKVSVNSSILGRAFQTWCGHGAINKRIPDFILYHKNINLVKAFLKGYFDGDGSYYISKKNGLKRSIATSISELLIQQCQLAIQRLGNNNWAAIGKVGKNSGVGTHQQYSISWYVAKKQYRNLNGKKIKLWTSVWKELEDYFIVPVISVTKTPYKGLVYNLETEDHTFCANNVVTHNCNRNIQHLPKGCCTVQSITDQFAKQGIKLNLKDDDTSENYYKELNKHSNRYSVETDADGNMELVIKDPNGKEIGRMKITICSNKDKQSDEKGNGDIPELAKEVIRQAIKEAHDATMKSQGHLPAGLEEAIGEWLKPPVISWRVLLRKFLAASIKSGFKRSWKRPNRRFGEEQKGKLSDRIVSVTIAIDTSGSISDEDFKAFMSEMKSIQSCYKGTMTVIECDADIQKTYKLNKYNKIDKNFKGRGGTSFKPVFEYIKDKKLKTDVLCFFTDGYGDQNECKKPPYSTIWVTTTRDQKFPFGHVISLVDNPDKKYKNKP